MSGFKHIDEFFDRNVSYSKEKSEEYEKLRNDPDSPFQDCQLADIFVYAVALGFELKQREKLKHPQPNINTHAFTTNQKTILLAIAVSSKDVHVLFNHKSTTKIIEEYANYGINHLATAWLGRKEHDPITQMCGKIVEITEKIESNFLAMTPLEQDRF